MASPSRIVVKGLPAGGHGRRVPERSCADYFAHPTNCKRPSDHGEDEETDGRKRTRRLTPEQVGQLEKNFSSGAPKLELDRKLDLAAKLDMTPRQVAIWFQNRRARCKAKELEHNCGMLKAKLNDLRAVYKTAIVERDQLQAQVKLLSRSTEYCGAKEVQTAVGYGSPQSSVVGNAPTSMPSDVRFASHAGDCELMVDRKPAVAASLVDVPSTCAGPRSVQSTSDACLTCVDSEFLGQGPSGASDSAPAVNWCGSCTSSNSLDTSLGSSTVGNACVCGHTSIPDFGSDIGRQHATAAPPRNPGTCHSVGRSTASGTASLTCGSSMSMDGSSSGSTLTSGVSLDLPHNAGNEGRFLSDICWYPQLEGGSHPTPSCSSSLAPPAATVHLAPDLDGMFQGIPSFEPELPSFEPELPSFEPELPYFEPDYSCSMVGDRTMNHPLSLWDWLDVVI